MTLQVKASAYRDFVAQLRGQASYRNMTAAAQQECLFALAAADGRAFGSYVQRYKILEISYRSYLLGIGAGLKEEKL